MSLLFGPQVTSAYPHNVINPPRIPLPGEVVFLRNGHQRATVIDMTSADDTDTLFRAKLTTTGEEISVKDADEWIFEINGEDARFGDDNHVTALQAYHNSFKGEAEGKRLELRAGVNKIIANRRQATQILETNTELLRANTMALERLTRHGSRR
jgi:hypothetical protein